MPKMPTANVNSEDSEYATSVYQSKGLYWAFDTFNGKDSAYIYNSASLVNCHDCDYVGNSELCYEGVDVEKGYNCSYLENSLNMRDSDFCYACSNCHDVFGCVNLKNKAFCIFNRQLTEADYKEQVKKYKALPAQQVLTMLDELKKRYPWTQTNENFNQNSSYGNYVYYCKNCYLCFDASNSTDCGYLYDSHYDITTYDDSLSAHNELTYESLDSAYLYNCDHIVWSSYCQDSSYLFSCFQVKNSLGCINLNHKQYCLLNRQLTKDDYERVAGKILQELRSKNIGWNNLSY
ncbi:MAG: hypothetical protein HYW33_03060 [Candidatus Blackburnbacteria bacterium]|nr:hypothetical protein [Candidatus Blackburnbacteria bacterium]